jgi:hypothetical protein
MKSKSTVTEVGKRRVVMQSGKTRRPTVVPLEKWMSASSVFPGGNFMEWIVESKLILAKDCSMLELLGWGIFASFHEAWLTGYYDPRMFDNSTSPWLRIGEYRLHLSIDGASLTVRRGNEYGHFIDTSNFTGDWSKIRSGLQQLGISEAAYPASPGRVAAGLLSTMATPISTPVPVEVCDTAWQACKGSRMEALSLGTVEGIAYDISSAFPFIAGQLPWAKCRWVASTQFQPDAYYGFALIDTDIPVDLLAGPIGIRTQPTHLDETELRFPVGKIRATVSQPEMALLHDMGIPFTIHRGWWGYPTTDIQPFNNLMQVLWELRQYDKAGAKSLSVACVGQLGSVVDNGNGPYEARSFFNPVYSAHIYSDTRCRIYRKALEIGLENVRAFTIDGIISVTDTDQLCGGVALPPKFGDWRLESEGTYFLANDYFKDRPGDAGASDDSTLDRWRGFVESTPDDVDIDRFQTHLETYIGPGMAMQHPEYRRKLGQKILETDTMPLGSQHRHTPKGVTRHDYLTGEIPTSLCSI